MKHDSNFQCLVASLKVRQEIRAVALEFRLEEFEELVLDLHQEQMLSAIHLKNSFLSLLILGEKWKVEMEKHQLHFDLPGKNWLKPKRKSGECWKWLSLFEKPWW